MVRLFPLPCVCHTTPPRRSPATPLASTVVCTARCTAWYWWYAATFFFTSGPSTSNTTKCRSRSVSTSGVNAPLIRVSRLSGWTSRPVTVFHGWKRSNAAPATPRRA